MTSTVIVKAHCSKNKRVEVQTDSGNGIFIGKYLQDGEVWEGVVYDEKSIRVTEISGFITNEEKKDV